jgi:predicted nucleic acid-binding protein
MTAFLIDTNVLSEYSRRGGPNAGVDRWLQVTDQAQQFVSVITLAEIQKGIELLPTGGRRESLTHWLTEDLERWFEGRVLPIDRSVASHWALLTARCSRHGRPIPTIDSLLAATAMTYDLTVVTRNVRDFEGVGVPTFDPWDE